MRFRLEIQLFQNNLIISYSWLKTSCFIFLRFLNYLLFLGNTSVFSGKTTENMLHEFWLTLNYSFTYDHIVKYDNKRLFLRRGKRLSKCQLFSLRLTLIEFWTLSKIPIIVTHVSISLLGCSWFVRNSSCVVITKGLSWRHQSPTPRNSRISYFLADRSDGY